MDADGRFLVGSDEFIELTGPQTTAAFGRLWSEIAAELKLDPDQQVARAVATRETWSGITVSWPVDGGDERLPVELSGLPVFDRERHFRGYRGFGVCRDIARINELASARRERPIGFVARPEPSAASDAAAPAISAEAAADTEKSAALQSPTIKPAAEEAEVAPRPQRPSPSLPPTANVVPFRPGTSEPKTPSLSPIERRAFRELAQELTARLQGGHDAPAAESVASSLPEEAVPVEAADAPTTPPNAEQILGEPAENPIAPPEPISAEPAAALLAPPAAEVIAALMSATAQLPAAESPGVAEVQSFQRTSFQRTSSQRTSSQPRANIRGRNPAASCASGAGLN